MPIDDQSAPADGSAALAAAYAGPDYGAVLWEPTPESRRATQLAAYARWLAERGQDPGGGVDPDGGVDPGGGLGGGRDVGGGLGPGGVLDPDGGLDTGGYRKLWDWSVSDPGIFWDSVWDYFGVLGGRGSGPALAGGPMPDVRWFEGATLNYARNALRAAGTDPDRTAVIYRGEDGTAGTLTYGELDRAVAGVAAGLRSLGVTAGDRVAAYLPNVPEALIGMLAAASLGAIWSSCSPDFGAPSVIDRFAQISPKVLIATPGYAYNGKRFDRRAEVARIAASLPDLAAVVLTGGTGTETLAGLRTVAWAELPGEDPPARTEFTDVPFNHPLWVLYSSGTTGLPKPIVHGHGGIVLEHLKVLTFYQDLRPGDVFFWYTTTGWMMWNYLAGGLLAGVTVVLYDGSATYPAPGALWELIAETGVTYAGTGAPYLLACAKAGLAPGREHDLSRLRGIGSTGSPLPPEGFDWVYADVGQDLVLGSMSGGTDVCTGFVGASPLHPVRAGVIAGRFLGARVEAFDEAGKPVTGEVGELVVTQPMPSMPVSFWNDPGGERYRASYYADYPGVWRHGDWIMFLPDGGSVIYGRSDATLNRGGVRMGTSEFYRVVERLPEIADSLVVDTGRLGTDGRLVLYVVMAPGQELDEALAARIRSALRAELSPRHAPDEIHPVPGIPRTLSGKKLEVPVRKILLGTPLAQAADPDSLANPEVLAFFAPREPK
jgi:acetoacetyl-CoA synthetase